MADAPDIDAALSRLGETVNKIADDRNALLSIARRWVALDAGGWHPDRCAADKAELIVDTLAAIAKASIK